MPFSVPGAVLNVEVDGPADAPPVLLWNGANCTLRMWDLVIERLRDRFRFMRFDVRGTGASTPSEREDQYTLEQYAEDACAILDATDVERTNVWSMAWGSRAAIAFAALHPKRVERAAFFDASIGSPDVEAQAEGHRRAMALQTEAGIEAFPRPAGWNVNASPESTRVALAAMRKFDLPAVVDRLTMPVLIATGDQDPNLASSRDIAARVPGARLVVMENVGHGSVLQRPDLSAEVFCAFMDEA